MHGSGSSKFCIQLCLQIKQLYLSYVNKNPRRLLARINLRSHTNHAILLFLTRVLLIVGKGTYHTQRALFLLFKTPIISDSVIKKSISLEPLIFIIMDKSCMVEIKNTAAKNKCRQAHWVVCYNSNILVVGTNPFMYAIITWCFYS